MSNTARRPALGAAYALGGALLFGINGSVIKVVLASEISAAQLTLGRSASTAMLAGAWLAWKAPGHFRITRKEAIYFAALGIIGLAMIQWLYATAITLLPVGVALLVQYTAVLMVPIAAWALFREQIHARLWIAIGAVLAGLTLVAQVWASSLRPLGLLVAFLAAVAFAYYFLAGERSVSRRPAIAVMFWASLFAAAWWAIFSGWWRLAPESLDQTVALGGTLDSIRLPLWVPLAWILTLGAFVPFLLYFAAMGHLSATRVGILAVAEVLFAIVVAWLWLGETLSPIQLVGAASVFVGIVIAQTARTAPPTADAVAGGMPVVAES